jgi:hypothetical protein
VLGLLGLNEKLKIYNPLEPRFSVVEWLMEFSRYVVWQLDRDNPSDSVRYQLCTLIYSVRIENSFQSLDEHCGSLTYTFFRLDGLDLLM